MLGLAATLSHTAIVWLIARWVECILAGHSPRNQWNHGLRVNFCDHYSERRVLDVLARTWRGERQQWLAGNHHHDRPRPRPTTTTTTIMVTPIRKAQRQKRIRMP